jgi:hypothetical protein
VPELVIDDLRGGLNDTDPPIALSADQCVRATNVEFHLAPLGERRRGAIAIDVAGSDLETCDRIVWTHRHLPTSDPADAQLWALGITDGSPDTATLAYKDTTWHTVAMADAPVLDGVSEYRMRSATLHAKLFLAYKSAVDRLHVWDGTSFRRVGMAGLSTAPTAANAGSGSFSSTRYYRVRETVQVGGSTILRSEASDVLTFAPSGSGSSVTVTKPATVNSDPAATHWDLEASLNNADFFVIATTAIGTTTASDSTAADTGYGAFELSEDPGAYTPPRSARILIADEDRLVMMGSFEDPALDSAYEWTPVFNASGVGNDERVTLDPVSILNLDGYEGGAITDAGRWAAGEVVVGKEAHVYKVIRTGNRQKAYDAYAESKVVGVIPGSMVEGVDESGSSALYFLDAAVGPYRFSMRTGLQYCGRDVFTTWQTVNLDATVVARSLFYRTNQQVQWRIATGAAEFPDAGLVLQTNAMRTTQSGEARRGFTYWTGPQCAALTMVLFSDNIDDDTDRSRTLVPFMGRSGSGLIWRCDTGDDDNGTDYSARITTKPHAPTQLQTEFSVRGATLVAKAVTDAEVVLGAIPDGGIATTDTAEDIDCTPAGSEVYVIRRKDEIHLSECKTVQIDFADVAEPGARWELARVSLTLSAGQGA